MTSLTINIFKTTKYTFKINDIFGNKNIDENHLLIVKTIGTNHVYLVAHKHEEIAYYMTIDEFKEAFKKVINDE